MPRDINLGPTGGPFVTLQENNGGLDVITPADFVDLPIEYLTTNGASGTVPVSQGDGTLLMSDPIPDGSTVQTKTITLGVGENESRTVYVTFADLGSIDVISVNLHIRDAAAAGDRITFAEDGDLSSSAVDVVYNKFINPGTSPERVGVDIQNNSTKLFNADLVVTYID